MFGKLLQANLQQARLPGLRLTIGEGAVKITPRCEQPTLNVKAEIAQLVEHATENCGVASSILALGTSRPDV